MTTPSIPCNSKFKETYMKTIPYIDPDSPRHVDWLFSYRAVLGHPTSLALHEFENDGSIFFNDVVVYLKEFIDDLVNKKYTEGERDELCYTSEQICRRYILVNDVPVVHYVLGFEQHSGCTIMIMGDEDIVTATKEAVAQRFRVPDSVRVSVVTAFDNNGNAITNRSDLRADDEHVFLADGSEYPFVDQSIAQIAKEFSESSSNLILVLGPAGTGKSTFIRTLMFEMNRKNNVLLQGETVISSNGLMPFISAQENGSLLMIEDADNLCRPREDGNTQMTALLGYLEGIVSTRTKCVISTNLPTLMDVDPALHRSGRRFMVINFRPLTTDEAKVVLEAKDREPIEGLPSKITLSDLLNWKLGITERPRVGF